MTDTERIDYLEDCLPIIELDGRKVLLLGAWRVDDKGLRAAIDAEAGDNGISSLRGLR